MCMEDSAPECRFEDICTYWDEDHPPQTLYYFQRVRRRFSGYNKYIKKKVKEHWKNTFHPDCNIDQSCEKKKKKGVINAVKRIVKWLLRFNTVGNE